MASPPRNDRTRQELPRIDDHLQESLRDQGDKTTNNSVGGHHEWNSALDEFVTQVFKTIIWGDENLTIATMCQRIKF